MPPLRRNGKPKWVRARARARARVIADARARAFVDVRARARVGSVSAHAPARVCSLAALRCAACVRACVRRARARQRRY